MNTGNNNDRIDIRAGAFNRGGYAEATGLNNSSIATAAGNDSVRIHAHARGMSTNAWAMRNSSLDVGPGHDNIDLRAVTRAGAFDPAYGMDTSSIITGLGNDKLRINAIARGNTTGTIAAYGALNSQINTGADDDKVHIKASATNRSGYAEATGLDHSVLETESGNDCVRIHAHARGMSTNAWAMRHSTLDVGAGHDKIDLRAVTRAGAFDPAYGMDTSSIITGLGNDKLRINAIARGNTTSTIAAYGALNSQINTGADDDKVRIRAAATNRNGYAEATGLDHSVLETEAGNDHVRIDARACGSSTNAWAMRHSTLDVGAGHDTVDLRAVTRASAFDPAYGMDTSSIITGLGNDKLRINAIARGSTTDTMATYGALNSQINTGADDDKIEIRASARNRQGYAEAVGLDHSVLETEAGDDLVRLDAQAHGSSSNAWAMRNSTVDVGPGDDTVEIRGNALNSTVRTGEGFDSVKVTGLETKQLLVDTGADADVLTVDGGTGITYISGTGSDQLRLTRNYFTGLLQAKDSQEQVSQFEDSIIQDLTPAQAAKAQTNQLISTSVVESSNTEHNQQATSFASPDSQKAGDKLRNPLLFVDFVTGENGDTVNCDDILIGHGIGLNRQSIFQDGYLSFAQEGSDSLLYFDSDGSDQQENDKVALVIFKDVQAGDFSQYNLSSRIINQNDFLLNQENHQNIDLTIDSEDVAPGQQLESAGSTTMLNASLQPANESQSLFGTNPTIHAMDPNQLMNNDVQASLGIV